MGWPLAAGAPSRAQLAMTAAGVLTESGDIGIYGTGSALASGTVYGWLGGLRAGDVVTGVMLRNVTAAVAANPTTFRAGIANSTGKILAISGNLNAAANMPLGSCPLPLAAQYTVLADGGYYACIVANGVWGTPPTPLRGATGTPTGETAYSTFAPPRFGWTGQTDLPAVGASLTLTAGSPLSYYMAFY